MGVPVYADLAGAHHPYPPFGVLDKLTQHTMRKLAGNASELQTNRGESF